MKQNQAFFRGCLLGGAIGDAMGWPVEFMSVESINKVYGPSGINDLQLVNGVAEITDDTQMTLFTAEGILSGNNYESKKGNLDASKVMHAAYLRWLHTQGYSSSISALDDYDSYLLSVNELHNQRAPGNSCLTALQSGLIGTVDNPINHSKGCGGVMRMAPVGLVYECEEAFEKGIVFAALTHGHPTGYLASGAFAYIIAKIIQGKGLVAAVEDAMIQLEKYPYHQECLHLLQMAIDLSRSDMAPEKAIGKLGEGWVAEEALAIAVYCGIKYQNDFRTAVIVAVNHNGDSDSTGAICGNLLGAYLGVDQIPTEWIEVVELKEVIVKVADELHKQYERKNK